MYKIFGAIGSIKNSEIFLKKISDFSKKNNLIIQVFDSNLIFGKNHLMSSIKHALRSMKNKKNTANSIEMEIMLYASGERQLKLAIPKMGIKKNTNKIAFIIMKEKKNISDLTIDSLLNSLNLIRFDDVLNIDGKDIKKFGINEKEITTVSLNDYEKLIIEKIALVDIIK
jgi:KEOPS complex subunit Cgi121